MGKFSEELENLTRAVWKKEKRKGEVRIPTPHDLAAHVLRNRGKITETARRIDALRKAALSVPDTKLFPFMPPSLMPPSAIDHDDSISIAGIPIAGTILDTNAATAATQALWAEQTFSGNHLKSLIFDGITYHYFEELGLTGGVAYLYMAACGYDVGAYAGADAETIERGLVATHAAWETHHSKNEELRHPIAPLVTDWLNTPPVVEPDTRRTGIFPKAIDPHSRAFTLPHMPTAPAPPDAPLGAIPDTAYLPGLAPPDSLSRTATPLVLYDMLGEESMRGGHAAPMALRLFVEALMLLQQKDRHMRRRVRVTLRSLRDWLYPNNPGNYKVPRILPLIFQALLHVDAMRVRVVLPGEKAATLWRPVGVTGYPVDSLDSPVIFDIELPPGSSSGALMDRQALRQVGVQSALKYRALLTLYVEWDRYGTHSGKRIYATRPCVRRDKSGVLVDRRGNPVTDKRGRQSSDWSKGVPVDENGQPTVWAGAAREPNPARSRYPIYTENDVLRLCYALGAVTQKNRRWRLQQARRALLEMERDGLLIIERNATSVDHKGWRIMPPDGFAPML